MKQRLSVVVMTSALRLYESLDTPISLGAALRLKYGEYESLARMSVSPSSYVDSESFLRDTAAVSLLKKLEQLPTGLDTAAIALQKWWEGERRCYDSNERLCRYLPEFSNSADRVDGISEVFSEAQKLIRSWIGSRPPELTPGRFGPGATFSDRGGRTTIPHKMFSDPTLTRDAIWWLPQWLNTQWGAAVAAHGEFSFVPGNRFTTVPKTCLTDRSIAVEPSINVFYQLAFGREIRQRLRNNAGWDLNYAQDIHRRVAQESSRSREFATLDLSNASDTVCKVLVRLLLPPAWYAAMNDLRSRKTLVGDRWVLLEKFSSMGNGFTFELETIIFAALCCVASRRCGFEGNLGRDVYVFGDDIIVKDECHRAVVAVLEFCGFSLNSEKSYHGGSPFRESCGGDFFEGRPVRPFFLKSDPAEPQELISYANGLRALSIRVGDESTLIRSWFAVLDNLPSVIRSCRGPEALGDLVIHDSRERWNTRWRGGVRYIKGYRPHRSRVISFGRFPPEVVLACATYGTGNRRGGVVPRDGVLSHKVGWVPYS